MSTRDVFVHAQVSWPPPVQPYMSARPSSTLVRDAELTLHAPPMSGVPKPLATVRSNRSLTMIPVPVGVAERSFESGPSPTAFTAVTLYLYVVPTATL